ncbi:MAG TPA: putative nitrogen fixation protein NifT [Methylophilaceae bacterium]|jgi:nitrogen fixation protein NifT
MKVMIRRNEKSELSAYVPKKDLEEPIVHHDNPDLWGGNIKLANGWVLALPEMPEGTKLPITIEAKKVDE